MEADLKYIELQNSIPDYVFGAMAEDEKLEFEKEVINFPELKKEIDDFSKAFSIVDRKEIDNLVTSKTRNISVKVNEKLNKSKSKFSFSLPKILIPTGLLASILVVFLIVNNNKDNSNNTLQYNDFVGDEIHSIIDNTDNSYDLLSTNNTLAYNDSYYTFLNEFNHNEDDFKFITDIINDIKIIETTEINNVTNTIIDDIEHLEEHELEELLKEIENEINF